MREDDRTMLPSLLLSFGRRRHRPCGACTPVFVWSTRHHPRVEASGSRVDGLLHDDGDEAIVVIPRHTSSVAASLFVAHHPRHHHPCRPRPLLHHCCRRSPATLVTVFPSLAALIVSAFIISHVLLLFVTTRCHARVHRPPSTLSLLVDCCIFTPNFGKSGKCQLKPTRTATASSMSCRRHGHIWPKLERHVMSCRHVGICRLSDTQNARERRATHPRQQSTYVDSLGRS